MSCLTRISCPKVSESKQTTYFRVLNLAYVKWYNTNAYRVSYFHYFSKQVLHLPLSFPQSAFQWHSYKSPFIWTPACEVLDYKLSLVSRGDCAGIPSFHGRKSRKWVGRKRSGGGVRDIARARRNWLLSKGESPHINNRGLYSTRGRTSTRCDLTK